MPGNSTRFEIRREPIIVEFKETSAFTEVYGFTGSQGSVFLEGQRIIPLNHPSNTVLIFMHPATTLNLMPLPVAMAEAGYHILCGASRYAKNDSVLIMEKVVADLGAYIRYAREVLGYQNVVLAGWSGGGSLAMYYQSQAENPTVKETPAGDAYDLTALDLPPADAAMFIAAHTGRARILSEWIDPSVINEADPSVRDISLDLYAKDGPRPPYSDDFIKTFRSAQTARVDRITDFVLDKLSELKRSGTAEIEFPFVVHRTMADPHFLDLSLEPNGRNLGCYLGNPETVNSGPVGLARFSTLRAWLSQWSYRHSKADAESCVANISIPLLVIENEADDAVPVDHTHCVYRAAGTKDKAFHRIDGATHYYRNQPKQMAEALACIGNWLDERNLR